MSKKINDSSEKLKLSKFSGEVRRYYNSFDPRNTMPSKLTFYKNLESEFKNIKIPDSMARMTFGCMNPVSWLIADARERGRAFDESINILDAGGGAGFDLFLIRQIFKNADIYNIDISHNLLKLGAKEFAGHLNIKINYGGKHVDACGKKGETYFICASLGETCLAQKIYFDYIISNAAFNLIPDKKQALSSMASLLKDDGAFFLADIAGSGGYEPERHKSIAQGLFNAPTIIDMKKYKNDIFDCFGYFQTLYKQTLKPEKIDDKKITFDIFCARLKKTPPFETDSITCICGEKLDLKVFLNVNAEESRQYLKMIADGSLNSTLCHKCRRIYTDFIPYFFEWPDKNIAAHIFPASTENQKDAIIFKLGLYGSDTNEKLFFGYKKFQKYLSGSI